MNKSTPEDHNDSDLSKCFECSVVKDMSKHEFKSMVRHAHPKKRDSLLSKCKKGKRWRRTVTTKAGRYLPLLVESYADTQESLNGCTTLPPPCSNSLDKALNLTIALPRVESFIANHPFAKDASKPATVKDRRGYEFEIYNVARSHGLDSLQAKLQLRRTRARYRQKRHRVKILLRLDAACREGRAMEDELERIRDEHGWDTSEVDGEFSDADSDIGTNWGTEIDDQDDMRMNATSEIPSPDTARPLADTQIQSGPLTSHRSKGEPRSGQGGIEINMLDGHPMSIALLKDKATRESLIRSSRKRKLDERWDTRDYPTRQTAKAFHSPNPSLDLGRQSAYKPALSPLLSVVNDYGHNMSHTMSTETDAETDTVRDYQQEHTPESLHTALRYHRMKSLDLGLPYGRKIRENSEGGEPAPHSTFSAVSSDDGDLPTLSATHGIHQLLKDHEMKVNVNQRPLNRSGLGSRTRETLLLTPHHSSLGLEYEATLTMTEGGVQNNKSETCQKPSGAASGKRQSVKSLTGNASVLRSSGRAHSRNLVSRARGREISATPDVQPQKVTDNDSNHLEDRSLIAGAELEGASRFDMPSTYRSTAPDVKELMRQLPESWILKPKQHLPGDAGIESEVCLSSRAGQSGTGCENALNSASVVEQPSFEESAHKATDRDLVQPALLTSQAAKESDHGAEPEPRAHFIAARSDALPAQIENHFQAIPANHLPLPSNQVAPDVRPLWLHSAEDELACTRPGEPASTYTAVQMPNKERLQKEVSTERIGNGQELIVEDFQSCQASSTPFEDLGLQSFYSQLEQASQMCSHSLHDAENVGEVNSRHNEAISISSGTVQSIEVDTLPPETKNGAMSHEVQETSTEHDAPVAPRKKRASQTSPHFKQTTKAKTKHTRKSGTACIPFPSILQEHFGLVQEKLAHNPFQLLLAVMFLNRTTGVQAIPAFYDLLERYPTPAALAGADETGLADQIRHLGLQNTRARRYIQLANIWTNDPPSMGRRHRTLNYPERGDGRDIKPREIIEDDDEREGAFEIGHLPGAGPYALDSWRIFCRDKLRNLSTGYNGEGAVKSDFEPEWKRVLPKDKELREYLRWLWLREGWVWDPLTGDRQRASAEVMMRARQGDAHRTEGEMELEDTGRDSSAEMEYIRRLNARWLGPGNQ